MATSDNKSLDPTTALASAIVEGLRSIQPPRSMTIDEFVAKTPFNPTGKKNRALPCKIYQNDTPMNIDVLHDEEIRLIGLLKPGKFIEGLVTVSEEDRGGDKVLHLRYKNGTRDQAMELKDRARNLTEILKRCVNEANGQVE